jgi:hypothetical protein
MSLFDPNIFKDTVGLWSSPFPMKDNAGRVAEYHDAQGRIHARVTDTAWGVSLFVYDENFKLADAKVVHSMLDGMECVS